MLGAVQHAVQGWIDVQPPRKPPSRYDEGDHKPWIVLQ